MPTKGFRIPLSNGLNLSVPRTELQPGELAIARNCHYRQDAPSQLAKVYGRKLFGSMAAKATGLAYVRFRSAGSFLMGSAASAYYSCPVIGSGAGTFTSRVALGSPAGQMEAVYFNGADRAYLMDGVNRMQVWTGSGNMRNAGGLTPAIALVASFLSNSGTLYVDGTTFGVCYTEYDSVNDVESPPSAVTNIQATAANGTFKYRLPTTRTNIAFDKIRLYRTQFGGVAFYRLAEFDFQASVIYYDGTNTDAGSPAVTNAGIWGTGFDTVDDQFLSTQPVLQMVGQPLIGNYMTANGEIPRGDIAFLWQNRLIVTGVSAYPQDVYASEADEPEFFSPVSFIREENGRGEPVTGGGVANDQMVIFTTNSLWRHNNFPDVTDPGFGLGLSSRELVTDDHGNVAKRCVVNFGIGQPNNRLFYLSARGPMMTDSFTTWPLADDLGWDSRLFNLAALPRAVARNFPKYSQIWLFLPSAGSPTNDLALIYHYHPNHFKRGTVGKWTGPVDVRCAAAAVVHEADSETRMFVADTDSSGNVYQEATGLVDEQYITNPDGDIDWEWMTGDNPFGEESRNKRVQRVFLNVVGTDSFDADFRYAINKRDDEHRVPLQNVTPNVPSVMRFGSSLVAEEKTRSYRGGIHQTGAHFRGRMQETARAAREVVSLELEIQPFGKQR